MSEEPTFFRLQIAGFGWWVKSFEISVDGLSLSLSETIKGAAVYMSPKEADLKQISAQFARVVKRPATYAEWIEQGVDKKP
jgi:hypothetical protein